MLIRTLTATAIAGIMLSPAFAQSNMAPRTTPGAPPPITSTQTPAASGMAGTNKDTFIQSQSTSDWRASKLIGTNVYGPDNAKIGDVNDVLIDSTGNTRAVVIGVGGFLGVGEKNVAVPFNAVTVTPIAKGDTIEKIGVKYTKNELKEAPNFVYRQASNTSAAPAERHSENVPQR